MAKMIKYAEIRKLSIEKLITKHDEETDRMDMDSSFYLREIERRDAQKINKFMLYMTIAICIMTLINVVIIFKK